MPHAPESGQRVRRKLRQWRKIDWLSRQATPAFEKFLRQKWHNTVVATPQENGAFVATLQRDGPAAFADSAAKNGRQALTRVFTRSTSEVNNGCLTSSGHRGCPLPVVWQGAAGGADTRRGPANRQPRPKNRHRKPATHRLQIDKVRIMPDVGLPHSTIRTDNCPMSPRNHRTSYRLAPSGVVRAVSESDAGRRLSRRSNGPAKAILPARR